MAQDLSKHQVLDRRIAERQAISNTLVGWPRWKLWYLLLEPFLCNRRNLNCFCLRKNICFHAAHGDASWLGISGSDFWIGPPKLFFWDLDVAWVLFFWRILMPNRSNSLVTVQAVKVHKALWMAPSRQGGSVNRTTSCLSLSGVVTRPVALPVAASGDVVDCLGFGYESNPWLDNDVTWVCLEYLWPNRDLRSKRKC